MTDLEPSNSGVENAPDKAEQWPEGADTADLIGKDAPDETPAEIEQGHENHVLPARGAVPVPGTEEAGDEPPA